MMARIGDTLPTDWRRTTIAEIADVVTGGTPPRNRPELWGGDVPWMSSGEIHKGRVKEVNGRITELGVAESNARWLPTKSVLLAMNGQGKTRGTAALLEVPTTCNQSLAGIIPKNGAAISEFLFFNLSSRYDELRNLTGDAARTGLNLDLIRSISLLLPPLPEQRKIAEILSSVDEAIERTEVVIERVQEVKRALAQELLTRGMPGRHTRYKQTAVGEVPEEWEVVRLRDVAGIQSGIAKNEKAARANPVTLPYLRVANVQDGYIDLAEVKSITVDSTDVPRCSLQPGDVLFTEGGDFDKLGRGAVWAAPISPCLHQNHVFAVRPHQEHLLPEYLAMYAASYAGKRYFLRASKQTTNLASVNATQLGQLPLALPSVDEQQSIMRVVGEAEVRAREETQHLEALMLLKETLASALLTGQIRVCGAEV